VCLDDFHTETKKIYVRCPTCHKRQIENPLSEGATYWLIDDVMMRRQRCEPCGEELQLQQCTMDASRGIPMSSLILQPIEDVPELKFCSEKMRYGRPFETSFTLHKLLPDCMLIASLIRYGRPFETSYTLHKLLGQPSSDCMLIASLIRYGRPFETSYTLHRLLGQPSSEALDKLKASGEDGIRHEMVEFYCSQSGKDAGSRDKDEYVGWPLIGLDGL
jgi:hypothetical protein